MKNLIRAVYLLLVFIIPSMLFAQSKNATATRSTPWSASRQSTIVSESNKSLSASELQDWSFPSSPLSALVSIPGATPLGVSGRWFTQGVHGLHNIQVDPDNPMNVHAVIMSATGVTGAGDTTTANFFPTRNTYYTFSSDGGVTWKTPKKLATTRSGYPDMILYKRNGVYVPIIADHHFTSPTVTDLFISVYVESGNPGDGNFKVGDCDRTTFSGADHDIIWPIIALSNDSKTLYLIGTVSPPTGSSVYDYVQFGHFTLDPQTGAPSNWSGWLTGPASGSTAGLAIGQTYSLRIAPSGKLGIVWQSYDLTTPDFGLYLSESTDNGTTWTDPVSVFANVSTNLPDATTSDPGFVGDPAFYLHAGDGIDMYYDQEVATVVFAGDISTLNFTVGSSSSFLPSSGTLMLWKSGMTNPVILLSKTAGSSFQTALNPALDTGAFLSIYNASTITDPQTTNLLYPTIGLTSKPNIWSIYYEVWANNDSSDAYNARNFDNTSDTTLVLPFHSIYRSTTTDDGATWTTAAVYTNDMSLPPSKHLDYRFPEVSTLNPFSSGSLTNYIAFAADTAAGNWINPRDPGFDNVAWYSAKDNQPVDGVKTNAQSSASDIAQNFPNPFNASTTFSVIIKNDDVVTLSVTDILGREVAIVYHGRISAGEHQFSFNTPNLGAGIYTYTLKTSTGSVSRTMSLVK